MKMTVNIEKSVFASKFFKRNDFFPIDVNFGDKEKIRITMRPKKSPTEIVDVYVNSTHIGIIVGLQKTGDIFKVGPAAINKSHAYRNILSFVFVKLLEYYGLDGIKTISTDIPENLDFLKFLLGLGLVEKDKKMVLSLEGDKAASFLVGLEKAKVEILSQIGQIEEVIKENLGAENKAKIDATTNKIVDKIMNMDPLGKKFWDNRKVAELNVMLSTAVIFDKRIIKKEFLEVALKTIVTSFETYSRKAYLEELFEALDGLREFSMPYIQKMVEKMRGILGDDIKALKKDHLRHWVEENMAAWKLTDKNAEQTIATIISESKLKSEDFGIPLKGELSDMVNALIAHYNGDNIMYGLATKIA
jgi:hypothetical protein